MSSVIYERMERGAISPRLDTMQAAIAAIASDLALTVGAGLRTGRADPESRKRLERQSRHQPTW
jgi:hypothetical protein